MGYSKGRRKDGSEFIRPTGKGAGNTFINLGKQEARDGIETTPEIPDTATPPGYTSKNDIIAMKQQELTEMFERHQLAGKDPSYSMRRRLTPSSMAELKKLRT